LSRGTNPGFAPGQTISNPLLHRWYHISSVPMDVALAWIATVRPGITEDEIQVRTGIYLSRDDQVLLYRDERGFRLLSWKRPD